MPAITSPLLAPSGWSRLHRAAAEVAVPDHRPYYVEIPSVDLAMIGHGVYRNRDNNTETGKINGKREWVPDSALSHFELKRKSANPATRNA